MYKKFLFITLLSTLLLAGAQFSPNQIVAASTSRAPGITVTASASETTESGDDVTLTITLTEAPGAPVTINVASTDVTEGTVAPTSRIFGVGNWMTPRTVTVSGVDDDIDDGNIAYNITYTVSSVDVGYDNFSVPDTPLTNVDDDAAGVEVVPTTLATSESGTTDSFTVALTSEPLNDVTMGISSSDLTEGTVSLSNLTFTPLDWNIPQSVTVTGLDDFVQEGDITYDVVLASTDSLDPNYDLIDPPDVAVTNADDDVADIIVSVISNDTAEDGTTATFTVVLDSEPVSTVALTVVSNDLSEGTVAPDTLTFSPTNWNAAQTVTVTGVNDDVDDGDVGFVIQLAEATSSDLNYNGINPDDVDVVNLDDSDTAGISVNPAVGLTTSEDGNQDTFTIVLDSQPTSSVSIALSSNNTAEGIVSPSSVTFSSTDWNMAQTVTVTGVNDDVDDGDVAYLIVTAAATAVDSTYAGLDAADVTVTNTDNDVAAISVSPTAGLTTGEDGSQDTFAIVLETMPTASVTIPLSSSDPSEGSVSPTSVTFTTANWNVSQAVAVSGVNDLVDDGDVAYSIITGAATSGDGNYDGLNAADVSAENIDNDVAAISVSPTAGLTTGEDGTQDTFSIVLNTMPSASVTIPLSSSNPNEGSVSPASITFTTANWNVSQEVTVSGVDDFVDDGDVTYSIITAAATSGDGNYDGLNAADVSAENIDNDAAGILVNPTTGLTTGEDGSQATFTIALNSMPTANVTIGLSSSNNSEGTVAPASVSFTTANWNTPQVVTLTGQDDDVDDDDQAYTIVTAAAVSSDAVYSGLNAADVVATNVDDDTVGFTLTPTGVLATSENGTSATFTIRLNSRPTANVSVGLSSSDTSEGTVLPSSVTFTASNWDNAQTVTVTGQDDALIDPAVAYQILTAPATSSDAKYNGLDPADVSVVNQDNDSAGAIVQPTTGLVTNEGGGSDEFTVVLTAQPSSNVTIGVSSLDTTEGQPTVSSLIFTSSNWNTPQTVTVVGNNDDVDDEDQTYTVELAVAVSNDPDYNGVVDPLDVTVMNEDDDAVGITVGAISGDTDESGTTATFTVVLDSQPTANVTVGVSSSDVTEGTVSPSSLIFTAANWDTPKIVTVTGVDDGLDIDGDQEYSVILAAASSSDGKYSGIDPDDIDVINLDGDSYVFMPLLQTAAPPITQESEPNDTRANATGSLTSGLAVSGGFTGPSDPRDYYYFEHGLGGDVRIELSNIPTRHDYDLFLRLEDGTLIAESRNGLTADELIFISNLPPARYYIEVLNFKQSSGGQYQVVVDY